MNIPAQTICSLALICYIISVQQNNKKSILQIQILSNILYGIQYLLLHALSAACMNVVSILSGILFYYDNKNNRQTPLHKLILIVIIIGLIGIITYDSFYSLIPIIMMVLSVYSIWQNNMTIFRFVIIVISASYIVYNIIVSAYIGALGSVMALISAITAIIRFDIKKDKQSIKKNNT